MRCGAIKLQRVHSLGKGGDEAGRLACGCVHRCAVACRSWLLNAQPALA
jgi:hypothetical protein